MADTFKESTLNNAQGKLSQFDLQVQYFDDNNFPPLESDQFDGRESLGILHNDFVSSDVFFSSDFLQTITEASFTGDLPRESLGILNIDEVSFTDVVNMHKTRELSLNRAYLRVPSCASTSSSVSNYIPSFNSISLEPTEISKIYSLGSSINNTALNKGMIEDQFTISGEDKSNGEDLNYSNCSSSGNDRGLNDSVFLESRLLGSRIADGSIFDTSSTDDNLNLTPLPSFVDLSVEETVDKPDTAKMFKNVDKLFPLTANSPEETNEPTTAKTTDSPSNIINLNSSLTTKRNTSNFYNSPQSFGDRNNESRCSHCSGNSKSKDAKELLQNLSVIISNENISNQSRTEVNSILKELNDVFCPNYRESGTEKEDSGHSSNEFDHHQENKEEILDLRTKSLTDQDQHEILDLSMSHAEKRRLSQSFSVNVKPLAVLKKSSVLSLKERPSSVGGQPKVVSFSTVANLTKLKPRKSDDDGLKKGPMKAVVPIGNMKRKSIESRRVRTPPKTQEPASLSIFKNKKTSTPKTESKLKPMAQSTPENITNKNKISIISAQARKNNLECPISPLASRSNLRGLNNSKSEFSKTDNSGSAPNLSRSSLSSSKNISDSTSTNKPPLNRRKSAGDLKFSGRTNLRGVRNSSITNENDVPPSVNPIQTKVMDVRSGSKGYLTERNRNLLSSVKPLNLLDKIKMKK